VRLLIIEDEPDMLRALIRGFEKKGYAVDGASDGEEGLELALFGGYDVIVLDLNLPGMDGLDILKEIRSADAEQRIIIVSARAAFQHRIAGLDLGANDYLIKPFDFGELEARVRSLLRRCFIQNDIVLECGGISIDTREHRVYGENNETICLTSKEYMILQYLALHRGFPVSAEELIEHIWGDDEGLFSNAVKVHISQLRKKLGVYAKDEIIETIRGSGYLIR